MLTAGSAVRQVELGGSTPRSWPALQQLVAALLATCDLLIAARAPGWLGHCKALISTPDGSAYASITGADEPLSWRGSLAHGLAPDAPLRLTLYCIAYGPDDATMAEVVERALAEHLPEAVPLGGGDGESANARE